MNETNILGPKGSIIIPTMVSVKCYHYYFTSVIINIIIIISNTDFTVKGFDLDTENRRMFWSFGTQIEAANFDGTGQETLFNTSLGVSTISFSSNKRLVCLTNGHSAVQSKNAVYAFIKHSRYCH